VAIKLSCMILNSGGREKKPKQKPQSPRALRIDNDVDRLSLCAKKLGALDLATLERSRAAGGLRRVAMAEARVGQPWPELGRSIRPGGTVAQPSDPP
jgi:hypothetical protein